MFLRRLCVPNVRHTAPFTLHVRAYQASAQATPVDTFPNPSHPSLNQNTQTSNRARATATTTMPADILPVDPQKLGRILLSHSDPRDDLIDQWQIGYVDGPDHDRLQRAATELRTTDIPVAFPTETVYGLGADATRSSAVQAIFEAKGRPSDNPLIVHVDGLDMLRNLLRGFSSSTAEFISNG